MKANENICKKNQLWILATFISAIYLLCNGCSYVDPKMHIEQTREGIDAGMQEIFSEYRQEIPKLMKKQKIPGFSVAVVDCNGILWAAGFGYTDKNKEIPITLETPFGIASMSKTFTATAVMCAVNDGLVELDTPITEYLPSFTVNSIYEKNPEQLITLRHLLSHRAGFTHNAPVGNLYDIYSPSFEDHVLSISDTWLKFPVGQKYSYSNIGIDLAGYILQVQSGKPLEQYVKEKIFEPLGMSHSSMDMRVIRENKNRAIGHSFLMKKVPLEHHLLASGGVYSSVIDLAKFVQLHLNFGMLDQREIIPLQVLSQMYRSKDGRGLGLEIGKLKDRIYHRHAGGGFGFHSNMVWFPEYGIGAIELHNNAPHNALGVVSFGIPDKIITQKLIAKTSIPWLENINELPDDDSTKEGNVSIRTFTPTPYKKEWSSYQGKYVFAYNGFEPAWFVKVLIALGYEHDLATAKIRKKDDYLTINNEHLEEVEPGLFFTASGEALDFRNDIPTWRNIKIKKR